MKRLTTILLLLALTLSCSKADEATPTQGSAAHFSTSAVVSRVVSSGSSAVWESGDAVGISSDTGDLNVKYTATSGGSSATSFAFADDNQEQILLPRNTKATYRAYYPYQVGSTFTSQVGDQSSALATDLLIASGAEGIEGMSSVDFTFTHALSVVEFTIIVGEELQDTYSDYSTAFGDYLTAFSITGAPTTVVYDLDGNHDSTLTSSGTIAPLIDSKAFTATAIINPTGEEQNLTLAATFGSFSGVESFKLTPAPNTMYKYNITLSFASITITEEPEITPWGEGEGDDISFTNMTKLSWGTASNPFPVETLDDLLRVGSGGTDADTGADLWSETAYYKLLNDLDCEGVELTMAIVNDIFNGNFNGNNLTISNFTITTTSDESTGLFPYLGSGGLIYDLTLDDCTISAESGYVGAVTGSSAGLISGCTVGANVVVENDSQVYNACATGGIVGRSMSLVERCTSAASVSGHWKVGGVVGYLDEQTVVNCGNSGSVTNSTTSNENLNQQGTGGVVGYSDSKSAITRCYNWGTIESDCYQTGGVAGYTNGTLTSGCYNVGAVHGYDYVGGVVGRVYSIDNLSGCYYLSGCVTSDNNFEAGDHGVGHIADNEDDTVHTTAMEDAAMQDATFVNTLNAVVTTTSSSLSSFTVYEWQSGVPYPIFSNVIAQ